MEAETGGAATEDAATEDAPTEDAATEDAATEDAATEDAATEDAGTEDATRREAVDTVGAAVEGVILIDADKTDGAAEKDESATDGCEGRFLFLFRTLSRRLLFTLLGVDGEKKDGVDATEISATSVDCVASAESRR